MFELYMRDIIYSEEVLILGKLGFRGIMFWGTQLFGFKLVFTYVNYYPYVWELRAYIVWLMV